MPVNIFEVDTVQTKLDNECTSVGLTIAQLICRYICLQYTWNRSYSGGMENRRMTTARRGKVANSAYYAQKCIVYVLPALVDKPA